MKKKLLIISLISIISIMISTYVFAENNDTNTLGEEIQDSSEKVENTIEDAGNSIKNGVENAGEAAGDMVEGAGNAAGDMMNGAGNTVNSMMNGVSNTTNTIVDDTTNTANNGYNTARTTTEDTTTGFMDTANTWMWITLAIVAVAIIGLVWYYAAQTNGSNHSSRH